MFDFKSKMEELRGKYNLLKTNSITDIAQYRIDSYNKEKGRLNEFDGYDCKICNNKGNIMYLLDGYEYTKCCQCMETRKAIKNMERSGLKNVIRDYTLDKYITTEDWQKEIKNKAIQYLKDDTKKWWFISGQSGGGKTHISTAICREYLLKGNIVKYMLWKEESTVLKACVNDVNVYKKNMGKLKQVEILYIDDFLKPIKDKEGQITAPTVADINLAFELIDYRKNANLRTIISSERDIQELLTIDQAIAGRIAEKATKEYVLNIGQGISKNYRLKDFLKI